MVRDAIDPGVDLGLVDQPAGGDVSVGLGDHLGFAGELALLRFFGFGAGDWGAAVRAGALFMPRNIVLVAGNCQRGKVGRTRRLTWEGQGLSRVACQMRGMVTNSAPANICRAGWEGPRRD
jgi:hypothetical protein